MRVDRIWLTNYRNYADAELAPAPEGLTVVAGANGQGKTNLLEGIAWLATLRSFRAVPGEALVRHGEERAVVRGEVVRGGREALIEAELVGGRSRAQVNRQPLRRTQDLVESLRVTVFSPDDLELVKGGPGARRRFLDELLVNLHPAAAALESDVARVLRQRTALLRQAGGRLSDDVATTLDVWDAQLARVGTLLAERRDDLVDRLAPVVADTYQALTGPGAAPRLGYHRSWDGDLGVALGRARGDDLRRAATTVGPHRDELEIGLGGLSSRTHGSQGEQRSLALALRLAAHTMVGGEVGESPVLLLDDVFSELDHRRSAALLAHLPPGQAVLTTVSDLPPGAVPAAVVAVEDGHLRSGQPSGLARTIP